MQNNLPAFFTAKRNVKELAREVSKVVARISEAAPVLERWLPVHVPHEPWRKRDAEDPLEGLAAWPTWENASAVFSQYRDFVRALDRAYDDLSPIEKANLGGPPAHTTRPSR